MTQQSRCRNAAQQAENCDKKKPANLRFAGFSAHKRRLHHAAHVGHATRHATWGSAFFSWQFADHCFSGNHQARYARCGLQRSTGDFGWVQNTHGQHVAVFAGGRVITVVT